MNHFMDFVCRGIVRSEDAIRVLNKRVRKLTKCVYRNNASVACIAVAGLLFGAVLYIQDQEIKVLQKQVADLAKDAEDVPNVTNVTNVATDTEEQNQQEGA